MLYFFINLAGHTVISLMLVLVLIHRLRINQQRKNRRGLTYLYPMILATAILFQMISFTIPRLLDTTEIISGVYSSRIGTVEKIDFFNNAMTLDGDTYFYNPLIHKPHVGDQLNISHTRYSGYVSEMKKVDQP